MKRFLWLWIALGVVLVAVIVVASIMNAANSGVVSVQLSRVRREEITARVKAPGKIEPKTQVKISADLMGRIVALKVKEGDRVQQGQLMLQLDDTQYRSQWEQAKAMAASGRAHLADMVATLRASDANYARQQSLFEQKLLSSAEWEQAQTTHETARQALTSAEQDAARSAAAEHAAADNLHKCSFLAPFDGVVSALNVEAGEMVVPGTMDLAGTQVMTVSDLSRMQVRADVDETDIVNMKLGQKAKISVDAIPDTTFDGTVTEIGNTAKRSITSTVEGQTNFEIVVVFDRQVPQVRPGMTADVNVETSTHGQVLTVPIQAVVVRTQRELDRAAHKQDKPKHSSGTFLAADEDTVGRKDKEITGVFVMRKDVAQFVPVRMGISSETMIEIEGDLKPADLVVSGPYKALRELKPGGKVKKSAAESKEKK